MSKLDDKINRGFDAFVVVGWMAFGFFIAVSVATAVTFAFVLLSGGFE